MNDRLLYYTSMTLPPQIPKSIQYHRALQSTDIALNNLKKINGRLDENNILTLAFLANNPHINNEDREKYEKQLKEKNINEYEIYSKYINELRRDENSSANESECLN